MTDSASKTSALNRREQRKLARERNVQAAAAQEQAVEPADIIAAQPVPPKQAKQPASRADQRQAAVKQAEKDVARVPDPTEVDFEAFKSRKPTLHELNQIAKNAAKVQAEEARVVAQAAAKAAHGALLGVRTGTAPDPYAAKAAAQASMDAARAAAAAKAE